MQMQAAKKAGQNIPIKFEETPPKNAICVCFRDGTIMINNKKIDHSLCVEADKSRHNITAVSLGLNTITIAGERVKMASSCDYRTGKFLWSANAIKEMKDIDPLNYDAIMKDRHRILHCDRRNLDQGLFACTRLGTLHFFDKRASRKPMNITSLVAMGAFSKNNRQEVVTCFDQSIKHPHLLALGGVSGMTCIIDVRNMPKFVDINERYDHYHHLAEPLVSVTPLNPKARHIRLHYHNKPTAQEVKRDEEELMADPLYAKDRSCMVQKFISAETPINHLVFRDAVGNSPPILATCGNDRKLRIFDVSRNCKDVFDMVYMRQRLLNLAIVRNADIYQKDCEKLKNLDPPSSAIPWQPKKEEVEETLKRGSAVAGCSQHPADPKQTRSKQSYYNLPGDYAYRD